MAFIILIIIGLVVYLLYSGRRGNKLYNQIKSHLINEPGWSEDRIHHVWVKYNKEIVNMELDGLSPKDIADKLKSDKYL